MNRKNHPRRVAVALLGLVLLTTSCATVKQTYEDNPKAVLGSVLGAAAGAGIAAAAGGNPAAIVASAVGERAENVARYLLSKGIPESRLAPLGFSSEFSAEGNETAQGRRSNRRVEVTVR
jgi:hypothetical protein